jgi:murein DD-endopeptidase MepM/ murein hydrolase activator NlpD
VTRGPIPTLCPELRNRAAAWRFGIRSARQLAHDLGFAVRGMSARQGFQVGVSTLGFARPDLSLPAYAGLVPVDGLAPVYHLYDRTTGGARYSQRVTRLTARDFRGGRLSYDDHDGVDFVCPVGTPLCAAAPGMVVAIRDRWLRGGLTVFVDHGHGVVTQYTHCTAASRAVGERVARGQEVARSGVSGLDLTISFPWVPPHVHFSVWVAGQVVDPFRSPGEPERPALWAHGNDPRPAPSVLGDAFSRPSPVDEASLDALCESCRDPEIRAELARAASERSTCAAIVEDALHHERQAFPPSLLGRSVRPLGTSESAEALALRLTLPLPATDYAGIRFADAPWTRPA